MNYTDEQINDLAEERFGNHPHVFGGQRDGFKEGFKKALELVKNNCDLPVVSVAKRKVCFNTKCDYNEINDTCLIDINKYGRCEEKQTSR